MRIDDNAEALAMMNRALGSLENKFREAYNKGYYDGYQDGARYGINKMGEKILKEVEGELTGSEKPNNFAKDINVRSKEPQTCEDRECENYDTINDHCMFIEQCHYEPKTEPQTETHDLHTETHECVKDEPKTLADIYPYYEPQTEREGE